MTSVYREAARSASCPRCGGLLAETDVHDAQVLECQACHGYFLSKATAQRLGPSQGAALRRAFPRHQRPVDAGAVRYLKCPLCEQLMNRVDFARPSRVIVDICNDDGTWFDPGEINGVIEFVEQGGFARAEQRQAQEKLIEKTALRAQWRNERTASQQVGVLGLRAKGPKYSRDELRDIFGFDS